MGDAPDVDPMDAAGARADIIEGGPYVVYLSHAKRIRDEAVAAERTRLVNNMNAEYGCPDCGVHHACGEIVAERDRLRAWLALIAEHDVAETQPTEWGFLAYERRRKMAQAALDGKRVAEDADRG